MKTATFNHKFKTELHTAPEYAIGDTVRVKIGKLGNGIYEAVVKEVSPLYQEIDEKGRYDRSGLCQSIRDMDSCKLDWHVTDEGILEIYYPEDTINLSGEDVFIQKAKTLRYKFSGYSYMVSQEEHYLMHSL